MSVELRQMSEDEYAVWRPEAEKSYAFDIARAGTPEEAAREKAVRDFARLLPDGVATEGQSLYTVVDDDSPVGVLWLAEQDTSDFGKTLFIYDVEIDEAHRGRGLGRAAMLLVEEEARRRGIGSVTLNVFGGNDVARNLYRSLDYAEMAVYMLKRV
jgi:ribosomal protein S18 acetylase RimI-like enzyme